MQECLTNIVRHAQAKQAIISLEIVNTPTTQEHLELQVIDDGKGVPLTKLNPGLAYWV